MDPFDGSAFEHIKRFKCTVVGPRCLLTCLNKNQPVPDLPYPMFTASMTSMIVTSTGFAKERKVDLQSKVEQMGGIYSNSFHDGVTHLVVHQVRSRKYEVAVSKEIPIMTADWIDQVWEKGRHENVHATDPQFSRYKCPALMGLNITVSQLNKKDRDLLKKSIEAHGGTYTGSLDMETTMLLVLLKPEGDKYKYAKKWKIPCVTSDWVFDSIEKGICMGTDRYRVDLTAKEKVSTPEKNDRTVAGLQEVSMCSTILLPSDATTTNNVNETLASDYRTVLDGRQLTSSNVLQDMSRVRKAGRFLEDCRIFLSGLSTESEEAHLKEVVQSGGGVCLGQLAPSVTHMVIQDYVGDHFNLLTRHNLKPYRVTMQWLAESMLMGRPVPEEDFAYQESPSNAMPPPPLAAAAVDKQSVEDEETQFEDELMAQYRGKGPQQHEEPEPEPEVADADAPPKDVNGEEEEETSAGERFLTGKKLYFNGLENEVEAELTDWVTEAGGELVNMDYEGRLDYLIVSIGGPTKTLPSAMKPDEVVTYLWLEECVDNNRLLPFSYFHRPIAIDMKAKPCQGVVIGITGYSGKERTYITSLATCLGMLAQEIFAKRDKKGAKKSTHLVCANPDGPKYEAAVNWGLPVVSKDWLLACLDVMQWVSEGPFLVGKSSVVTPNKPLHSDLKEKEEPQASRSTNSLEQGQDEDDDEVVLNVEKRLSDPPVTKASANDSIKTPEVASLSRKTKALLKNAIETPDSMPVLDMEKLKPKRFNLNDSNTNDEATPSKWVAGSSPSVASQSQSMSQKPATTASQKRKRFEDEIKENEANFYIRNVKTPETPYGAFLKKDPSPRTRKFFKRQCEELGRFELPPEELARKRAKLDESMERAIRGSSRSSMTPVASEVRTSTRRSSAATTSTSTRRRSSRTSTSKGAASTTQDPDSGDMTDHLAQIDQMVTADTSSKTDEDAASRRGSMKVKLASAEATPDRSSTMEGGSPSSMFDSKTQQDPKSQIVWVDPQEEAERAKLAERLAAETQNLTAAVAARSSDSNVNAEQQTFESMEVPDNLTELINGEGGQNDDLDDGQTTENKESTSTIAPRSSSRTMSKRSSSSLATSSKEFYMTDAVFMMSGLADELRERFTAFAEAKGATVSTASACDPAATHVIAQKLGRSEKILCSIASGKMIINSTYIQQCIRRGELLYPEKFEWGNPDNGLLEDLQDQELLLAKASYRWRVELAKEASKGVFSGFQAIIHTSDSRKNSFSRLLSLGHGRVLDQARPPYSDAKGATHCLAEPKKIPKVSMDYKALANQGVAVVGPLYINEYLVADPPPQVDKFIIEEYRPFWEKRKNAAKD